jgi:hypothetical protein
MNRSSVTQRIEDFIANNARLINPDEFSDAEAIHPINRGKKVFFYHATTSPNAPHNGIHPLLNNLRDELLETGAITQKEWKKSAKSKNLLNIIQKKNLGYKNASNFLSGLNLQDSPDVFHAGTLKSAFERMEGTNLKAFGEQDIFVHTYAVKPRLMNKIIWSDEIQIPESNKAALDWFDYKASKSVYAGDREGFGLTREESLIPGKKVSMSRQVHAYRNTTEDIGNISVSVPKSVVRKGGKVNYAGSFRLNDIMSSIDNEAMPRQAFEQLQETVQARRAEIDLGSALRNRTGRMRGAVARRTISEAAEITEVGLEGATRVAVQSKGTTSRVIEGLGQAIKVMRSVR